MPDDQHDRASQQCFADPARGGLCLAADHDQGEDENGDDGGLGGEVPGGDGYQRPAERDERDEPFRPGQDDGEPGEEESA